MPDDDSLLGPMIRNICYGNARNYLALPAGGANGTPTQAGTIGSEGQLNLRPIG